MIAAAFFDLDGTLVDSAPGVQAAVEIAWRAVMPLEVACPAIRSVMGPPLAEMFRRLVPEVGPGTIAELIRHFRAAYDGAAWQRTSCFDGVLDALAELQRRGVRRFGATNKPALPTARILAHCRLSDWFEAFTSPDSSAPSASSKGDALAYLIRCHGLDPARAVLVGDTVDDAGAAAHCGLKFLAFRGGYGWEQLALRSPVPASFGHYRELAARLLGTDGAD